MPKTRANFRLAIKKYIEQYLGQDAWDKFLEALSDDDQILMQTAVSIGWVDMDARLRIVRTFENVLGTGNGDLVKNFARFEAEKDLNTVLRIFLRMANPGMVLKKASGFWHRFYDWGELVVEQIDKNSAIAMIKDAPFVDPLFCMQIESYFKRFFELVGAKDMEVVHRICKAKGAEHCIFEGKWK
jgi:predicted hydrocarbon binding protein